ncbi:hypothetical protein Celaphus_00019460 [Cervus elaphus hippelaphus]|uniref:Core shell protein Gag P30 domain-containing protein n=1 Tax=Cervus elaphus hippelaphus TaxID=46360 RepID=A0A212C398_CEREH|nr:hypothetical protein Celaphus_00019460 [Cervus elaphus hippelaphus]
MTRLPPRPEAALKPDPGPGEGPAAATALPELVEPPCRQAPIPAMKTSGQCPQNSTSAGPRRLYPPLPVSTDGKGEENTAIRQRLCSTREHGERTPLQMPLRDQQQPPVQDAWGTTISLLQGPPYSGEPQAMIRLMKTSFRTHRPTKDDIIQLLVSLCSPEERHKILTEARKWFREMAPEGTANPQRRAEAASLVRGMIVTVTWRKGEATWRDIR